MYQQHQPTRTEEHGRAADLCLFGLRSGTLDRCASLGLRIALLWRHVERHFFTNGCGLFLWSPQREREEAGTRPGDET